MEEQLDLFDWEKMPESAPVSPDTSSYPRSGPDETLTRLAATFAENLELPDLAKSVSVKWNPRMRTAAGRAFFKTNSIELNPKLQSLPGEIRSTEIINTFLHELAHLVSHTRAGKQRIQPHGPEWREACIDLGIPGEDRCHTLDFQPRRMKKRYAYECLSCGTVVKRVRKLKRNVACFYCCRAHSGGRFDPQFQLVEKRLS